ncbi:MAG TPA: ABC transporter permease, partial [Vicinamibacterales bacterium]|nr:ABC transporter permease [Vicinamibacterales bacterium]
IGANTAIFSVVNTVLLRPLPYPDADRLLRVVATVPAAAPWLPARRLPLRLTAAELTDLRQSARSLSNVGTVDPALMNLRGRDPRLQGATVSASFFELLGARPQLGRVLTAADESLGAEPVILLSADAWRRHFNADPDVVGRRVTFDAVLGPPVRTDFTVIGVMPDDFAFPSRETRVWRAPQLTPVEGRPAPAGSVMVRLADTVSREAAAAEVLPIVQRIVTAARRDYAGAVWEFVDDQEELVRPVRPALLLWSGAVAIVLLLACVNVANLLLARGAGREREFVIRSALGAGRVRLVRHLLTESITLGVAGGIAGVCLAFGGVQLLRVLATTLTRLDLRSQVTLPRLDEVGIDLAALGFAAAISIATGVLFGLMPALRYARPERSSALAQRGSAIVSGFALTRRLSMRGVLVMVEVGLAVVLLACGGLLMRSFAALSAVDGGYDPANVLTFQVALPIDRYPAARQKVFASDLVERIRAVPGVERAAFANQLPMVGLINSFPLRRTPFVATPGQRPEPPPPDTPDIRLVSREFLDVMRIRVIAGRGFTDVDGPGRPRVMLINEALARRDFADRDPVGTTVYIGRRPEPWQIVGVVANVRQFGLDVLPQPQFFVDLDQWDNDPLVFPAGAYYAARTSLEPESLVPAIRDIVLQLDPQAVLFYVASMEEVVASTVSRPRLYATLLGVFSAVGLGLAVIGIYGVMAYLVTQRTREIGIRVALGARRAQVIGLVVKQSAVLTVVGIVIGLAGAAMLSHYLEALLFGVSPLDPMTFAAAAALFALAALAAAYGPARRATAVDPLVALRAE